MAFAQTIGTTHYVFPDLRTLLARATPFRSGDALAGVAAESAEERIAAQRALADLPLKHFLSESAIPYETAEVTRLIHDSHDKAAFAQISSLTIGGLRDWLLADAADSATLAALAPGLTPAMVAAVSKIMLAADPISFAAKCFNSHRFRNPVGTQSRPSIPPLPQHPNH